MTNSLITRLGGKAAEYLGAVALTTVLVTVGGIGWEKSVGAVRGCSAEAQPKVSAAYRALLDGDIVKANAFASYAVVIFPDLACTNEAKASVEARKLELARQQGNLEQAEEHRHACAVHAAKADWLLGTLPQTEAIADFCDPAGASSFAAAQQGAQCAPPKAPTDSKARHTVASPPEIIEWSPPQSRAESKEKASRPKRRPAKPQLSCRAIRR